MKLQFILKQIFWTIAARFDSGPSLNIYLDKDSVIVSRPSYNKMRFIEEGTNLIYRNKKL